uniref:TNase-like domain-containing protein n=2 Tax=Paenibacillus athensensis TaxID=1967502 RepID=A0A4Y8PUP2_9BACL
MLTLLTAAALLLALAAACSARPEPSAAHEMFRIERVIDGDTVQIRLDGRKESVRLIGIDTPETKKPDTPVRFYGPEASEFTTQKLQGATVGLEWDIERRDRYGRLLAYVWLGDELFNRTLVQRGYARIATFPPNVKYVDALKKDQEKARSQGLGLWQSYEDAFPTEGRR